METRQILVPLDLSTRAESVLPYAVAVAHATSSTLLLLQVLTPDISVLPPMWPAGVPIFNNEYQTASARRQAQAYLAEVAHRLMQQGIAVRTEVLLDEDIASAITQRASQDAQVAMVAMTTHGRSGLQRLIFGSVAERVLHTTAVPLLLVRCPDGQLPPPAPEAFRTILVPLDGSSFAEQALGPACEIARTSNGTLVLMEALPQIDDPGLAEGGVEPLWLLAEARAEADRMAFYLEQRSAQLVADGIRVRTATAPGRPADAILRVSEQEQTDLIVMATHGRTGLQRFWLGSVAIQVMQRTARPVLLVHGDEHGAPVVQATDVTHSGSVL